LFRSPAVAFGRKQRAQYVIKRCILLPN